MFSVSISTIYDMLLQTKHYKCTAHNDIKMYFITKNFLLKMQTWRLLCCNLLFVSNFVKLANHYDLNLFLHAIWCIAYISIVDQNTHFFPNFFFFQKNFVILFTMCVRHTYDKYIHHRFAIVNVCTYSLNLSNSFKIKNFNLKRKNWKWRILMMRKNNKILLIFPRPTIYTNLTNDTICVFIGAICTRSMTRSVHFVN